MNSSPWALIIFPVAKAAMTVIASLPLPVEPDQFVAFDTDPQIVSQLADDRLSKVVIRRGEAPLDATILTSIVGSLLRTPEGAQAMIEDLKAGDRKLRDALASVLTRLGYDRSQANQQIANWVALDGEEPGFRPTLNSAMERAECRSILVAYLLDADSSWLKVVRGSQGMRSESKPIRDRFRQSLINLSGANEATVDRLLNDPGFESEMQLTELSERLRRDGSHIGLLFEQRPLEAQSLYERVWREVAQQIAADPKLMALYLQQGKQSGGLAQKVAPLVEQSISTRMVGEGEQSFSDTLLESMRLGDQRAASQVLRLLPRQQNSDLYDGNRMPRITASTPFRRAFQAAIEAQPGLINEVLWYLTRPAEASSISSREGIFRSVSKNVEIAQEMIQLSPIFSERFDHLVRTAGGFASYGSGAEMRVQVSSGKATTESLEQYMTAASYVLLTDDREWASAVAGAKNNPDAVLTKMVTEAVRSDPVAGAAWAQTLANNDPALRDGFFDWLISTGASRDHDQAQRWMGRVTSSLGTRDSMDQEFDRFRHLFSSYLRTRVGWGLAWNRLAIETILVPTFLRQRLVLSASNNPEAFWTSHSAIAQTSGPMVDGIKAKVAYLFSESRLPEMILEEAEAGNPFVLDSLIALWPKVLAPQSGVAKRMAGEMQAGRLASSAFAAGVSAAARAVLTPAGWEAVEPYAEETLMVVTPDAAARRLIDHPQSSQVFLQKSLNDPAFVEIWRNQMLEAAAFDNKGDVIARVLAADPETRMMWRGTLLQEIARNPSIASNLVEALLKGKAGDGTWDNGVLNGRDEIAWLVFSDRVFFEQILDDPNQNLVRAMRQVAERAFGEYTAKQWLGN